MKVYNLKGTGLVRSGVYLARLDGIYKIDPSQKESITDPSYRWHWELLSGPHRGRFARGLTPRVFGPRHLSKNGRLTNWVDVLYGKKVQSKNLGHFCPLEKLEKNFVEINDKRGITCKIRVRVKFRFEGPTDYRVSSIVSVVK